MEDPKELLIHQIHEAFHKVILGNGVSLHETIVLDNYGSERECIEAREGDEKRDWRKLIDDPALKEVTGIGGLSFYDAVGLRFHLPAYMILALNHPFEEVVESLLFTLTHLKEHNRERFSILSKKQKQCVCTFLEHILQYEAEAVDFYRSRIEVALESYWK